MNREKFIRTKFYNAIAGQLTYPVGEAPVDVFDEKLEASNNIYVLFLNQSATYTGNFCGGKWDTTLEMEIVSKQENSVSKDVLDDISEQIENLIPYSFPVEQGWEISNIILQSISYAAASLTNTKTVITKTLVFNQTIIKQ